jgi:hypothetical protein
MPKFFVGQRVKLARPKFSKNLGMEGIYLGPASHSYFDEIDCSVNWLGKWPNNCSSTHRLEPILPEGHKAGDFSYEELLDHLKDMTHEQVS